MFGWDGERVGEEVGEEGVRWLFPSFILILGHFLFIFNP